jgi:hypothetical protein
LKGTVLGTIIVKTVEAIVIIAVPVAIIELIKFMISINKKGVPRKRR